MMDRKPDDMTWEEYGALCDAEIDRNERENPQTWQEIVADKQCDDFDIHMVEWRLRALAAAEMLYVRHRPLVVQIQFAGGFMGRLRIGARDVGTIELLEV